MIKIGDKIDGRFRIVSRIATGGMADVYEANDLIGKRVVTLKVMKEELLSKKENVVKFEKETACAASFNHPNIVKVYGRGQIEGRPYLCSEYIRGQTLRDKLNFQLALPLIESCQIMLQLTSAIDHIHKHGIIHRDIKPDNIFYLADGSIKITDFGISVPVGYKDKGHVEGTIYYCSPEVLLGNGSASPSNDIYSMGVLFFELITGQLPFDGPTHEDVAFKHTKKRFPEPSKVVPSIPRLIDRIIVTACRKNPSDRYEDAMAMHDAIAKALKNKENLQEKKSILSKLFGFK